MLRRRFLALAGALSASPALAAAPRPITVLKSRGCVCCDGWVTHMRRAGFAPKVLVVDDLPREWRRWGVPDALSSCHIGLIEGYVTVGHVPPADVQRLLREQPSALGVTVPGMPFGSPGMERPDGRREAYETLLLLPNGRTRVFSRHG
jgi:hypothetical protein